MARQWFAEGVQVFEEETEEFFVEGTQINEDQEDAEADDVVVHVAIQARTASRRKLRKRLYL